MIEFPAPRTLNRAYLQVLLEAGPLTHSEVCAKVALLLELSEAQLSIMQDERRKKFDFRMAWAKSGLKDKGYISVRDKIVKITDSGEDFLNSI
jgi:hypothetical protein